MIMFSIPVWDIIWPLLLTSRIIVYLQSKESNYFCEKIIFVKIIAFTYIPYKLKIVQFIWYEKNIVLAK